jgi:hypothetical protein
MAIMTDDELKAITDQEIKQSLGYGSGEISDQRMRALDYYMAKPIRDLAPPAIDGRSSVVSTDVLDTVEWMLPSLLKMFVGTDKTVEFEAKSEEYEEQARCATAYINDYVLRVQNNAFTIFHTWFKDALLSKVGVLKLWWDTIDEEAREDYNGLDEIELAMLLSDTSVEPIENSTFIDNETGAMLYNVAVKRKKTKGFTRIENVPPEEFLISRRAKNIEDADFVAHRFERTIGELKSAGYKNVDELSSDELDGAYQQERVERRTFYDDMPYADGGNRSDTSDKSSRVVWVTECYMKVDVDGDGIPEWRKITRCGNSLLDNIECDGNPFVTITPIPMPHQFFGLSVADLAMESQRTKTSLMRAMIDNLYLSVNGRSWALEGQVNMDDLLTSRPGGIVRVKTPNAVGALQSGNGDMAGATNLLEIVEQAKENRTGFTRASQGTNPDALNQTATGMNIITNRADMRIELIARNFAETGVRNLFLKILELVSKYQDNVERIKSSHGRWVDIDPREWKNQFHLSVSVGLGTGNKDQIEQKLNTLGLIMKGTSEYGITGPQEFYNGAVKMAEVLGFANPEKFFKNPAEQQEQPQQQPPPDPTTMQIQAAIQINERTMQLKEREAIANLQFKDKELMAKIAHDKMKLDADIMLKREEIAAKIGMKQEEMNNNMIEQDMMNGFRTASQPGNFQEATGGMVNNTSFI